VKRYEFRKVIFKNKAIDIVYIYCTYPVKKIVGFFNIGEIIEDNPKNLWGDLSDYAGLNDDEFFSYFDDNNRGFAIEITNLKIFEVPLDPIDLIPEFVPPQSFCYLDTISSQILHNYLYNSLF